MTLEIVDSNGNPIDLVAGFEDAEDAITIANNTDSVTIPGPNNSFWSSKDTTSPYRTSVASISGRLSTVIRSRTLNTDLEITFFDGVSGPPTVVAADAGGPYRVVSGETVALFGAATVENASGDTTYAWARKSGSGGRISSTTVQNPTFSAPTLQENDPPRTIVYTLTATNNRVTATSDAVINVVQPGGDGYYLGFHFPAFDLRNRRTSA